MFKYLNIKAFKYKRGYTVFFAVLVASLALAVGLAVYDAIAVRCVRRRRRSGMRAVLGF